MKLNELMQHDVFKYFGELSNIPRCSYDEKKVSDYLVNFAKERNFEVIQDNHLNVIIRKPATNGKENQKPIVLQGHMDMVCEKTTESNHDFTCDPIALKIENECLTADGTTLGADDGIAVAMGLAILDSDNLKHPPIELLVTTAEETGMDGAIGLKPNILQGDRMINIDSEEEGIFLAGCAGGTTANISLPFKKKSVSGYHYEISIDGMKGGHSGMEIHQPRENAIKIVGELLNQIKEDITLIDMEIGTKHNAIPRVAKINVIAKNNDGFDFSGLISKYKETEPQLVINSKYLKEETMTGIMEDDLENIISLIHELPTGVYGMMKERPSIVETSDNLAILNTEKDKIKLLISIRSSASEELEKLYGIISKIAEDHNAIVEKNSSYPAWEYKSNSALRDQVVKVYKDIYKKDAEISVIHAGLECGLIGEKYPNMDMISMGPNMYDVHTPDERLEIESTKRVYEFLVKLLEEL